MTTRKQVTRSVSGIGSILSTTAGPSAPEPQPTMPDQSPIAQRLVSKTVDGQALATGMPENRTKSTEYGDASRVPQQGASVQPLSPEATSSTSTEIEASEKVGDGEPFIGNNALNDTLDRVRVDSGGKMLTTNQGVPIADNQHSLKIGLRGPTAMEDFILREKLRISIMNAYLNVWSMPAGQRHTAILKRIWI